MVLFYNFYFDITFIKYVNHNNVSNVVLQSENDKTHVNFTCTSKVERLFMIYRGQPKQSKNHNEKT